MKLRSLLIVAFLKFSALCPAWGSLNEIEDQQALSSVVTSYSLKTLPNDPLAGILSYATVTDLSYLWETGDKAMQERLTQNVHFFNMARRENNFETFDNNRLKVAASRFPYLRELNILLNHFVGGTLPDEVTLLTQLRVLNIRKCDLISLPQNFSVLSNLETLDVSGNKFADISLSDKITLLPQLRVLNAEACVTNLFNNFSRLSNLGQLNVSYTEFVGGILPNEITLLTQLRVLHIRSCKLINLSTNFFRLSNLEELNASYNELVGGTLLDEITLLPNLRVLNAKACELRSLSDNFSRLSNLKVLNVAYNQLVGSTLMPLFPLLNLNHLKIVDLGIMNLKKSQLPKELHPYASILKGVDWEN